jgi:hypothetical protein
MLRTDLPLLEVLALPKRRTRVGTECIGKVTERGGVEQPGLHRAAPGAATVHLRLVVREGVDDVELQAMLGQKREQRRHLGDVLLEQRRIGASERDLVEVSARLIALALRLVAVRKPVPGDPEHAAGQRAGAAEVLALLQRRDGGAGLGRL